MALDPNSILIKAPSLTTREQALKYIEGVKGGTDYVNEIFRLYPESGYSPEVVLAQWDLETGKGTSVHWRDRYNPAGIGVTDGGDLGYKWATAALAGQAQEVHLSAYVDGYNRGLRRYLSQDPRYLLVLGTDWGDTVDNVAQLTGKWATDPEYGNKIAARLEGIRATVVGGGSPGTAPMPPITWEGTQNFNARAVGQEPWFMVHHITDDMNYAGVKSWFQTSWSEASAHFVIQRDGRIMQFVSSLNFAWTNGDYYTGTWSQRAATRVARSDIPRLNEAINQCNVRGVNLNGYCISIEYMGTPSQPPTEAQYASGIALTKYFLGVYPTMSPHRYGQLRHADINPVTRSYCPGPAFNLEKIITAVGGDPTRLK